jgi:hypothetical protein
MAVIARLPSVIHLRFSSSLPDLLIRERRAERRHVERQHACSFIAPDAPAASTKAIQDGHEQQKEPDHVD